MGGKREGNWRGDSFYISSCWLKTQPRDWAAWRRERTRSSLILSSEELIGIKLRPGRSSRPFKPKIVSVIPFE